MLMVLIVEVGGGTRSGSGKNGSNCSSDAVGLKDYLMVLSME